MKFIPNYVVRLLKILVLATPLSVLVFMAKSIVPDLYIYALMAIWAVSIVFALLTVLIARHTVVEIDHATITYTHGFLNTKKTILQFSNVTEASYGQTLVQRLFGLGTLTVDSPGGSELAIRVEDFSKKDLESILSAIRAK